MTGPDRLAVLLGGEQVACLERTGPGPSTITLRYESHDVRPVSVRFPTRDLVHSGVHVENWLSGLLPDDEDTLAAWRLAHGVSPAARSPYDLLATPVGHDCAGAVQFCAEQDAESLTTRPSGEARLSGKDLEALVTELYESGRAGTAEKHRYSLGGAQSKAAVRRDDNGWSLPSGAAASTHIIKPQQKAAEPEYHDMPLNEHVCQTAARRLDLPAAYTELEVIAGIQVLVTKRFDRYADSSGRTQRIHQEDACQMLGVDPITKYEDDGGPTVEDVVALIRQHSRHPEEDLRSYADALIYNWLICGTDAHAKNYSFLHRVADGDGTVMAPLYDLISSMPYCESGYAAAKKGRFAQKLGGAAKFRDADYRAPWGRLAVVLGVPEGSLVDRTQSLARDFPAAVGESVRELPKSMRRRRLARDLVEMSIMRSDDALRMPDRSGNRR